MMADETKRPGGPDDHDSPANPDNQIGLERQAADAEHQAKIAGAVPERARPDEPEARARPRRAATPGRRGRHGVALAETPSTGHEWDGIKEYDNPLPRWWLWSFYATIVWAIGYMILYPALPLVRGATQGLLGFSTRGEVAADITKFEQANAAVRERLVQADLASIPQDPELVSFATNAGGAVFRTNCIQCHGSGAAGNPGYPSLIDDSWLWGGTLEDIHLTLQHGIRDPHDPDTRYSEMPKFGVDGLLEPTQISQVTDYVLSLSGAPHDAAAAQAGAAVYTENCAACHQEDGSGDRAQGAPALNDQVWLYGGDAATINRVITNGPFGVMPAWADRLSEADIRAVATYVHGLGGGE